MTLALAGDWCSCSKPSAWQNSWSITASSDGTVCTVPGLTRLRFIVGSLISTIFACVPTWDQDPTLSSNPMRISPPDGFSVKVRLMYLVNPAIDCWTFARWLGVPPMKEKVMHYLEVDVSNGPCKAQESHHTQNNCPKDNISMLRRHKEGHHIHDHPPPPLDPARTNRLMHNPEKEHLRSLFVVSRLSQEP